jgi:microcystin-dependent protein
MSRAQFHETITVPTGPGGSLVPLGGISATPYVINPDGTEGAEASAYTDRTGSTAAPTLVTDSSGYVGYWLDVGDYNIHFADTDMTPRIASYIQGFCAAILTPDALITAAENVLFFTGDLKFTFQTSDHGLKVDSTYEWLLVQSAGDGGGRSVSQADYPNLWSTLGSPSIDVGGNFRLPNLSGRVLVATGDATGLSGYTLMELVGEENHVLVVGELATHAHVVDSAETGVTVDYGNPLYAGQQAAVSAAALGTSVIASAGVPGGSLNFVPIISPYGSIEWGGRDLNHNHPAIDPGHNHPLENTGGNSGHNTIQPSVGMNLFIKT